MNMFRQIKEMRRLSREIHSRKSSGKDREGNYVINIGVSDGDTFLSPYSIDGEPLISAETAAFMAHSVKHLRPDAPLHFVIRGKTIDETEKPKYESEEKRGFGRKTGFDGKKFNQNAEKSQKTKFFSKKY